MGGLKVLGATLLSFAQVVTFALSGNFSAARAAWDSGTQAIVETVNSNMAKIKADKNLLSVDWSSAKCKRPN